METVYLGLGANLRDRRRSLESAIAALERSGVLEATRISPLYETEPLEPPGEVRGARAPWYLNAVAEGRTALSPDALLAEIRRVESELGRAPQRARWAPREIDIDILIYGDRIVRTAALTIPHAGLTARRFVLAPLADLAPHLVVPGTTATVAQHLSALHDPLRVILYAGSPPEERA